MLGNGSIDRPQDGIPNLGKDELVGRVARDCFQASLAGKTSSDATARLSTLPIGNGAKKTTRILGMNASEEGILVLAMASNFAATENSDHGSTIWPEAWAW
jgi:hypothetical protein